MLFLKRLSDEFELKRASIKNNIDFNAVKGKIKIPNEKWKDLLDHFNQPGFVLVNGTGIPACVTQPGCAGGRQLCPGSRKRAPARPRDSDQHPLDEGTARHPPARGAGWGQQQAPGRKG